MARPRLGHLDPSPVEPSPDPRLAHPSAGTSPFRHSVVALVGAVDRRAVTAVDAGRLLGDGRLTALHVVEPGEDVQDLGRRWMDLRCSCVPLRTVDGAGRGGDDLAAAIVDAVTPDAPGVLTTVVLAHLEIPRRWQWWLHDRSAARIVAALGPVPGVRVLRVPVPVPV